MVFCSFFCGLPEQFTQFKEFLGKSLCQLLKIWNKHLQLVLGMLAVMCVMFTLENSWLVLPLTALLCSAEQSSEEHRAISIFLGRVKDLSNTVVQSNELQIHRSAEYRIIATKYIYNIQYISLKKSATLYCRVKRVTATLYCRV